MTDDPLSLLALWATHRAEDAETWADAYKGLLNRAFRSRCEVEAAVFREVADEARRRAEKEEQR